MHLEVNKTDQAPSHGPFFGGELLQWHQMAYFLGEHRVPVSHRGQVP